MYYHFDKQTFELSVANATSDDGYRTKFWTENGAIDNKMFVGDVLKQCLTKRTSAVRWIEYDVFYRARKDAQRMSQDWTTQNFFIQCEKEIERIRNNQFNQAIQN